MKQKKGTFIVWKKFQRRVEVLAPYLDLEICYFHYSWEEKSKIFKALSYFLKSIDTFKCLFQNKPILVFVQFPPTPALYCVTLYSWLTGSRYVSDCHIGLTNAHWLNWIYAKKLLAKGLVIVHNEHLVEQVATSVKVRPFVVRDGVAKKQSIEAGKNALLDDLGLSPKRYVIFPCSFSSDEPVQEVIEAARMLPEIMFVMTWYTEKLSRNIRDTLPSNVLLTDYLQIGDYNCLFANSGVVLGLTIYEAVQLACMQEAMAFEIPAVVSDLKTTRFLYKNYPVFVKNDSKSIAYGVSHAFQNRLDIEERMKRLRIEWENEFFDQIVILKSSLNL
jgi:hypothetical protein